ncbi:F-box domain-containing protein [Mycena kentingensis (nom. inval.)]|nr:F-box domain-containing protein [Mycena kentingensis (nom. inval.)]
MSSDSPFAAYLGTNNIPHNREIQEIQAYLADRIPRLQSVEQEIAALNLTRDALSSDIVAHQALVSPIKRAPLDILLNIFEATMPAHNCVMTSSEGPLLLGRVCSEWRRLVYSSPTFWSRLHIVLPGDASYLVENPATHRRLEAAAWWLQKSGGCPLSITVYLENGSFDDAFNVLRPYAHRWKRIGIQTGSNAISTLFSIAADEVPLLQSLSITEGGGQSGPSNPQLAAMYAIQAQQVHWWGAAPPAAYVQAQLQPHTQPWNAVAHGPVNVLADAGAKPYWHDAAILRAPLLTRVSLHSSEFLLSSLPLQWDKLIELDLVKGTSSNISLRVPDVTKILALCPMLTTLGIAIVESGRQLVPIAHGFVHENLEIFHLTCDIYGHHANPLPSCFHHLASKLDFPALHTFRISGNYPHSHLQWPRALGRTFLALSPRLHSLSIESWTFNQDELCALFMILSSTLRVLQFNAGACGAPGYSESYGGQRSDGYVTVRVLAALPADIESVTIRSGFRFTPEDLIAFIYARSGVLKDVTVEFGTEHTVRAGATTDATDAQFDALRRGAIPGLKVDVRIRRPVASAVPVPGPWTGIDGNLPASSMDFS